MAVFTVDSISFLDHPLNTARDCRSSVCRQVGLSADSEHNSRYFPSLFSRTGYPTLSCNSSTVGARSPITLSTPSLPSIPLSRPAQVHHSFRFGDGMNKKIKSDIFDPPLITLYLQVCVCVSVRLCLCVFMCVRVCMCEWLWCRMMGIAARPCQRDISQSILSSSYSSSFAPSFLPRAAFPQALRSNIKKMAALGGRDCQFSAVSYGNSCLASRRQPRTAAI